MWVFPFDQHTSPLAAWTYSLLKWHILLRGTWPIKAFFMFPASASCLSLDLCVMASLSLLEGA
jgi:hypothetical protein